MTAGYGMVPQGVFRVPYGLQRGGNQEDPLAALIGNALGTYTSATEKAKADALAAKREQDQADWRNLQSGISLTNAGLTTVAPSAPSQPGQDFTTPRGLQPKATPAVSVGGQNLYRAGPTAAEQRATDADARQRTIHQRVGHALAQQMLGHDVDDDTAEGLGTNPQAFVGLQRTDQPRNIDPLSPQGIAAAVERSRQEAQYKTTPQQGQQAEYGAGALAAWQQVERERHQNPQVEVEVGKILTSPTFVHAIPGFKSSADMVSALQKAGASDAAQRYMRAKWSFLDNVIRTRIPGGRMSGVLFNQVQQEFMPGLDAGANAQIRANELQGILSAQGLAGYDVNPDVWNRAVRRHGVANIDLQALLGGGSGDSRMTGIRERY